MKTLFALLTALCLLLGAFSLAETADDAQPVTLIYYQDGSHSGYLPAEAPYAWGHGTLSFSIDQGVDGTYVSVSYGTTDCSADEVLGWQAYLNGDTEQPIGCDVWYVFPKGTLINYVNQLAAPSTTVTDLLLVPVLAEGVDPASFPPVHAVVEAL